MAYSFTGFFGGDTSNVGSQIKDSTSGSTYKFTTTDTYEITTTDNTGTTWITPGYDHVQIQGQKVYPDPYAPEKYCWPKPSDPYFQIEPIWKDWGGSEPTPKPPAPLDSDQLLKLQDLINQQKSIQQQLLEEWLLKHPPDAVKPEVIASPEKEIPPVEPRRPRMIRIKRLAA